LKLSSNNLQKEYKFIKKYDFFNLNIGSLPPGYYQYEAKSNIQGKYYSKKGSFHVTPLVLEDINKTAHFDEMNTLSLNSSGKLYFPDQVEELISKYESQVPSSKFIEQQKTYTLNDLWPVLIFLLLLFSTELMHRKYIGKL
jgi:hypothetical protein